MAGAMSRSDMMLGQQSQTENRPKEAATNVRGIPYAPFVDKVEDYVSSRADVDKTMKSFQEMISSVFLGQRHVLRPSRKYQFMQASLERRKAGLDDKIPDLQRSLETVRFLRTRQVRPIAPARSC